MNKGNKCLTCDGTKKVRGIGMMMVACHICKGKGVVFPAAAIDPPKDVKKEHQKGKRDEA